MNNVVPIWTLTSGATAVEVPGEVLGTATELTAERLKRMRRMLAA